MSDLLLFGTPPGGVTALDVSVHHDATLGTWVNVFVHWHARKCSMIVISPPEDVHVGDVLMPWHGLQAAIYKVSGNLAAAKVRQCMNAMDRLGCEVKTSGGKIPG